MRSKDRLAELQLLANRASVSVYRDTVELAIKDPVHSKEIEDIFQEVESIRRWIHDLENNTQLVRRLHANPTFHTNRQLQDQLDSAVTSSNATGLKLCGALRQLEARVTAAATRNDAAARIARLQYAATRRLYTDALERHYATLDTVKESQMHLLQQQMRLTNLTYTDEECEALLESNNISFFVNNVEAATAEERRILRDVEARHEELVRVEAALVEVRDLFIQLSHLVYMQAAQIDSVMYFASQAEVHVGTGGDHLLKGTVSRTKTRKKKLGLVICLVTGVAIVLLVLIIT